MLAAIGLTWESGGVAALLVAAIAALWRKQVKADEKAEKEAEDLKSSLTENHKEMVKITGELGELKGKAELAGQVAPMIQSLHEQVLEAIAQPTEIQCKFEKSQKE